MRSLAKPTCSVIESNAIRLLLMPAQLPPTSINIPHRNWTGLRQIDYKIPTEVQVIRNIKYIHILMS